MFSRLLIFFFILISGCTIPCGEYNLGEKILPVPKTAVFMDEGYYTWGGSMTRSPDGQYHLYYSRWPVGLGFQAWVTHSEIAHAVADHPLGPYHVKNVALPPRGAGYWDGLCTHNPTIHHFNNKYYLYYMGNTGDWKNTPGLNMLHRNNQRIGVAVSDHPDGPWQRSDTPLVDVSPDSTAYDALMVSNPSIALRRDGKYILIYKAVGKQRPLPFGGPVVHLAATAASPEGPFEKLNQPLFLSEGADFPAEDPYIWVQDDCFYAILKDMKGYFTDAGQSLVLFSSPDGLEWSLAEHPLVSGLNVRMKGGHVLKLSHLERPQLYMENGKPAVLFCAADSTRKSAFNIHIPLKHRKNEVLKHNILYAEPIYAEPYAGNSKPNR